MQGGSYNACRFGEADSYSVWRYESETAVGLLAG